MKFLSVALKNLLRRRVRSALTLLGIAIGITMLFSFMSFNQGYQSSLQKELNNMGAHVLAIAKGCPYEATAMVLHGGTITDFLTEEDLASIRSFENVGVASGMFMNQKTLPDGKTVVIYGLDNTAFDLKPWWVVRGDKFLNDRSVILPEEMAAKMGLSIGSTWQVPGWGETLTVTGLLERTGSQDDQFIYLPLAAAQEMFNAPGKLTTVSIQLKNVSALQEVVKQVESLPDVQAVTMNQVLGTMQTLMNSAQAMITTVVVIAVLISTIGVVNSILMSVFERTREIGMMKAVGASQGDVFALVWIEGIMLSLAGGLLGILMAVGGGALLETAIRNLLPYAPSGALIVFSWPLVGQSMSAALLLGILASAYPALRASRLSPMEAIRSE